MLAEVDSVEIGDSSAELRVEIWLVVVLVESERGRGAVIDGTTESPRHRAVYPMPERSRAIPCA